MQLCCCPTVQIFYVGMFSKVFLMFAEPYISGLPFGMIFVQHKPLKSDDKALAWS